MLGVFPIQTGIRGEVGQGRDDSVRGYMLEDRGPHVPRNQNPVVAKMPQGTKFEACLCLTSQKYLLKPT